MRSGTWSTPTAFTDSQKRPSAAAALPIVVKQTSSPLRENPFATSRSTADSRYSFEAHARPTDRGMCAATGEKSDATWIVLNRSRQCPAASTIRVA